MKEDKLRSEMNTYLLDMLFHSGDIQKHDFIDAFPGIIHLNAKEDMKITVLNNEASRLLGRSAEEINEMGMEFFHEYLHPENFERVLPYFLKFYEANDTDAVCGEFQFVKLEEKYTWVYTCAKIQKESDCFLSVSLPLDNLGKSSRKLERLLGEHLFARKNYEKFRTLSKREKEILTKIAKGCTNKEIGDQLFISTSTVKTHRKRIKKKLDVKRLAGMIKYALAFGLLKEGL